MLIKNPILKGFNPDPSIVRVGEDYYIATSTFEWFPGVNIYHSKDLVNWELVARPLDDKEKLDLIGIPNSGGVWAPCLSFSDGKFYLIYSIVRTWEGVYKDVDNFLITAENIKGPWSSPIYLNSAGFDPSLFHDINTGKKWLLCVMWDYRKSSKGNAKECFSGIMLQEYDAKSQKLVGEVYNIFKGTELGLVEAPHLYYYNGYYYLMTAEGGTFYEHAVTLARSKDITGPYEVHPDNPILTSYGKKELELQRAGHASLVETPNGEFYLAHLCGRPHRPEFRCNLGRETALQKMYWKDGWLYKINNKYPEVYVEIPYNTQIKEEPQEYIDDFSKQKELSIHYYSLRVPINKSWLKIEDNKLKIKGRESLYSEHFQSTIGRRVQHFNADFIVSLTFNPELFYHSAGIVYFYDTDHHYYLRITYDEDLGKVVNLLYSDKGNALVISNSYKINNEHLILKMELRQKRIKFLFSENGNDFCEVGEFDATVISDEYCGGHFTGAFFGIHVEDMLKKEKWVEIDFIKYKWYEES